MWRDYQFLTYLVNSEAREWRHDSDKTLTNKLESWMILKISLRAKVGVPKTLVKRKFRQHSLYFPHNTLMLTESCGEFSDLHSIFRLRALRYCCWISYGNLYTNALRTEVIYAWLTNTSPEDMAAIHYLFGAFESISDTYIVHMKSTEENINIAS